MQVCKRQALLFGRIMKKRIFKRIRTHLMFQQIFSRTIKHQMSSSSKSDVYTFVVTGANGFVAQWCVKFLLEAGHKVRGTVRDAKSNKNDFLKKIDGADQRLELFSADLSVPDAYDDVVVGADYVLHVASPYVLDYKDAEKELIRPAVDGTLSVLKSVVKKNPTCKRVVLTSSFAAVCDAPDHGKVFTENDWNKTWKSGEYYRSKTLAEQAAWQFAGENKLDLVTINPYMVVGPSLNDLHNGSTDVLENMVNGKTPAIADFSWGFVDVRDVAHAHINAALFPAAKGRYILCSGILTAAELVNMLRAKFPQFQDRLPTRDLSGGFGSALVKFGSYFEKSKGTASFMHAQVGKGVLKVDNSKSVNELKINYKTPAETIVDSIQNSIQWGHIKEEKKK